MGTRIAALAVIGMLFTAGCIQDPAPIVEMYDDPNCRYEVRQLPDGQYRLNARWQETFLGLEEWPTGRYSLTTTVPTLQGARDKAKEIVAKSVPKRIPRKPDTPRP